MSHNFGKVAVLLGGISNEREISLESGKAVLAALIRMGIDAHPIDPIYYDLNDLKVKNFNRAFICLHGRDGEDGKIQGILDEMNIPYTEGYGETGVQDIIPPKADLVFTAEILGINLEK